MSDKIRVIVTGDINSPWRRIFTVLTVAFSATVHTNASRHYHIIRTPPALFYVALSMRDSTRHSNCICLVLHFRYLFCIHWGTHFETDVQNSVLSTIVDPQRKEVTEGLTDLHSEVRHSPYTRLIIINPLNTKRRPLYLKTQSVPRSKHFSSRL